MQDSQASRSGEESCESDDLERDPKTQEGKQDNRLEFSKINRRKFLPDDLRKIYEETPFLEITTDCILRIILKYCNPAQLFSLAATCTLLHNQLDRISTEFQRIKYTINFEKYDVHTDKQMLMNLKRILPQVQGIRLGPIKTSKVLKYLQPFTNLKRLDIVLRTNDYFSRDKLSLKTLSLYSHKANHKNIVYFLRNIINLRYLSLTNAKITPDIIKVITRFNLKRISLIECSERFDCLDYKWVYAFDLREIQIENCLEKFTNWYLQAMPHKNLKRITFEYQGNRINVEELRKIRDITILFSIRALDDMRNEFLEFITQLGEKPIIIKPTDNRTVITPVHEDYLTFVNMTKDINRNITHETLHQVEQVRR